jgi:hypothetical protein
LAWCLDGLIFESEICLAMKFIFFFILVCQYNWSPAGSNRTRLPIKWITSLHLISFDVCICSDLRYNFKLCIGAMTMSRHGSVLPFNELQMFLQSL